MEILTVHASSLCACTHMTTVFQTDLTLFIWLSKKRIYFSKIRPLAMEILAVHASSLCACTHVPTVSQTDLTVFNWLSPSRI